MKSQAALFSAPATPQAAPAGDPSSWSERVRRSKALIPVLAVLGVTTLALAASLVAHRSDARLAAANAEQPPLPQAVVQAPPAAATQSSRPALQAQPGQAVVAQAQPQTRISEAPPRVQAAPCANCGTVESVTAVQHSAPASGVGAVAGGVVGGLLGNQIGGGSGRTAMTVLGAVGGGYAGHTIEKNMNKRTVYRVRVRMDDGSLRTVEQSTAVAAGSPVVLHNGTVRPAQRPAG